MAIVNETLAQTMFGDADPLGQSLLLVTGTEPVVIVGVTADRNNAGLRAPPEPEVVVALRQWGVAPATLLVRWENEPPPTWRRLLGDVVKEADPGQFVVAGVALTDELNSQTRALRLFAFATNAFAAFALLLCGFGINAVIAAMQQRQNARNRFTHGARRHPAASEHARARNGRSHHRPRPHRRRAAGRPPLSLAPPSALRRRRGLVMAAVRGCRAGLGRRRARGGLLARPPRRPHRAHGSAALRVMPPGARHPTKRVKAVTA